ncbi:MAG TPA: histidinol-phosphatase HisJ family protein [Chloroflexia bacterium]|nr:histidinol-phosphatase HisJ family protein [Chloroflexia bacterium]
MSTNPQGTLAGLHDYHMHSYLCGHGVGVPAEYAAHAANLGLDEIGFSEHVPMYWLPGRDPDPELAMTADELPLYFELVEAARRAVPDMPIHLGLEADYIPGHEATLAGILAAHPWDYVYGSVHFLGTWGMDDARYVEEFERRDIDAVYEEYFGLVEAAARSGMFDIMAHLDLVKKFGHRATGDLRGLYAQVARTMAASEVCVEVNSAGLRKPVGEIYPHIDLLRALYVAGVPVTLGSDAHQPDHVGADFATSLRLLREVGYQRVVRFANRERSYVALP